MTNSFFQRLNDHRVSFGMERYSTGNKPEDKHIWKFLISKNCGGETLFSAELTLEDFAKTKLIIEKCMEIVRTDGGRKTEKENER